MSEKLRVARMLTKMNQEDVAKYLGISTTSYSNKETGKIEFTVKEAKKLLELFNKKFEELF